MVILQLFVVNNGHNVVIGLQGFFDASLHIEFTEDPDGIVLNVELGQRHSTGESQSISIGQGVVVGGAV